MAAVSGGSDSTALLLLLREAGVRITAAHFDHALRPGSAEDARRVAALCRRLGVPLISERRRSPLPRGSRQAAARRLRYEFLERARAQAGADLVCLGHTADDLVEGTVLHLLRGCGLAGMRGMPQRRGRWVRPLLDVWRSDLRRALERSGFTWLEDPSNLDVRYARSRVRHELLPRLERDRPGLTGRLRAAATRASELHARLEREARPLHDHARAQSAELAAAPGPVRREALRQMYAAAGGFEPGLDRRQLVEMERLLLARRTGARVDLPGFLQYRVGRGQVEVVTTRPERIQTAGNTKYHMVESGHYFPGDQPPS